MLEFASSTYWAAKKRESNPSARVVRDEELKKEILGVWKGPGRQLYGARKVWGELNRQGVTVAEPLNERQVSKLTLKFEKSGPVDIDVMIGPAAGSCLS